MWFCFNTELLWLFFSLLFAVFSTIAELWLIFFFSPMRNGQKAKEFFGETQIYVNIMFCSSCPQTR